MKKLWIVVAVAVACYSSVSQELTISADGIDLTPAETSALSAAEGARLNAQKNTNSLISATVAWVDHVTPEVLDGMGLTGAQRTAIEGRIAQMRADLILLGRKRMEQLQAFRPSGVEIRRARLSAELVEANRLVTLEQGRFDALEPDADPDRVAARQAALDAATAAAAAAQAALDAFNVAHPAP